MIKFYDIISNLLITFRYDFYFDIYHLFKILLLLIVFDEPASLLKPHVSVDASEREDDDSAVDNDLSEAS